MFKFQKGLIAISLTALLTGCYPFLYQPPVKQGNIINPNAVAMLKPGMTKQQVTSLMGTPVLDAPLSPDTWYYVDNLREKGKLKQQKQIILHFKGDKLVSINS